jgi:hypothetical protein
MESESLKNIEIDAFTSPTIGGYSLGSLIPAVRVVTIVTKRKAGEFREFACLA